MSVAPRPVCRRKHGSLKIGPRSFKGSIVCVFSIFSSQVIVFEHTGMVNAKLSAPKTDDCHNDFILKLSQNDTFFLWLGTTFLTHPQAHPLIFPSFVLLEVDRKWGEGQIFHDICRVF